MKYIAIICLLSLAGCTADKIFNEPDAPDAQPEIHFHTFAGTRADGTENLNAGAKVCIYPYLQKTGVTAPAVDPKDYTVGGTNGNELVPSGEGENGKSMILPSGTFRFYAISTNSTTVDVPEFSTAATDGKPILGDAAGGNGTTVAYLQNGVDYLHVMAEKTITFGTTSIDVPLNFAHKGTQVQLTIIFGGNVGAPNASDAENFALAEVWVQATDPANSYMRLNSGEIRFNNTTAGPPQACNLGSGDKPQDHTGMVRMNVIKSANYTPGSTIPANQVATYNMLPMQAASGGGTQKLWVQITVQNIKIGETIHATHTYTGKLDVSAGWKSGESNQYTLTLSGSEITFSGVTVESWVAGGSGGEVGDVSDN